MKPNLLLIGSSGLLGTHWARYASKFYKVTGTLHERIISNAGIAYRRIDIGDVKQLKSIIDETEANVVVNCAGMTNIEECEAHPKQAYYVNVLLAENLATSCSERNIKFIQISTDHVFGGKKAFSNEFDPPEPINTYAKTKAMAEEAVMKACSNALVIRTNFFGWGPYYKPSFSDVIIRRLRASKPIYLFTDAFFTPILVDALVEDTHKLLEKDKKGIFNVVGDERISKFEFGCRLANVFKLNGDLIKPALMKERTDLTIRPLDISLSSAKLHSVIEKTRCSILSHLMRLRELEFKYEYF